MRLLLAALLVTTVWCSSAQPVQAVAGFQKVFLKHYIEDHPDEEYVKFVKTKAKCWVCHQGKKRKNHNPYGEHLEELLDKKKDAKDEEKIVKALETVGKLPSDPENKESPTYAELIAAGKLPGGTLEEVKKEPEGAEEEKEAEK